MTARTFCGPAKVRITTGGRTVALTGGSCFRTQKYLTFNIGTVVLGSTTKPIPNYFGMDVGRTPGGGTPAPHDGTYPAFALTLVFNRTVSSGINTTVTLTHNRTQGTFRGTFYHGAPFSGSFRCT